MASGWIRRHAAFLGLSALFVGVVLFYSAWLPPFEGPDEPEHLAYVLLIRQQGRLPDFEADRQTPVAQQVGQAPLYYLVAAALTLPVDVQGLDVGAVQRNPWHGVAASVHGVDNRNYALMNPAIQTLNPEQARLSRFLRITRLASLPFGLLMLAGMYWGGLALLDGRRDWALMAPLLFGLLPNVVQNFATVSNDAASLAFSALVIAASLHLVDGWRRSRLLLLVGMLMGLGALSKVTVLVLWVIPALAILVGWWRALSLRKARIDRVAVWALLRSGVLALLPALLIAGWWFVRNALQFGDPLGTTPHQFLGGVEVIYQTLDEVLLQVPILWETLWFNAGWGQVRPPDAALLVPLGALLLSVSGLLRALRMAQIRQDAGRLALLLAVLAIGLAAVIHWMQLADRVTGRLYLPYVTAAVWLAVYGLRHLWDAVWLRLGLAALWISTLLVLIPATLGPAFGGPALINAPPDDRETAWIDFGGARFVGTRNLPPTLAPDAPFSVDLCWQAASADAPLAVPYAFAVHVVANAQPDRIQPGEPIVARRESYPGMGTYTRWQPGRTFCDDVALRVDGPIEAGRRYAVYVTLFDPATTIALPAYAEDGELHSKIVGYVEGVGPAVNEQP